MCPLSVLLCLHLGVWPIGRGWPEPGPPRGAPRELRHGEGRRGWSELVRVKGRHASLDLKPSSQLVGLARDHAHEATNEGACVGEGRRGWPELVHAKGCCASPDLGPCSQLDGLARGGTHEANKGARARAAGARPHEGCPTRGACAGREANAGLCFCALGWLLETDCFGCRILLLWRTQNVE
ncbi:hypothetical protein BDA96_01G226600 [Sorghum bicolor]|uniref:Uncharacterized protein n=1 Tax=Sorghum bicolor TaxID=4558 RepID=A0A921RZK0_SORBI|nr:hypothetical protein BDA96_01G226600 [Sorghum bicolor]